MLNEMLMPLCFSSETFSIRMVVRDHSGIFIESNVISFPRPATILEAESIGVKEALF